MYTNKLRIGVTARITNEMAYIEKRDAISTDWYKFINDVIPEASWMILPNLGHGIINYVMMWGLNGFILTGGNDISQYPERDETEIHLIDYALENEFPTLGVCRGFQILSYRWGVEMTACPDQSHIATRHGVDMSASPWSIQNTRRIVNSYHRFCAPDISCYEDSPLIPFVFDKKGFVEGVYIKDKPVIGFMWHPERESVVDEVDKEIIRKLFLPEDINF